MTTAAERERDDREEAESFGRVYLSRWVLVVRPFVDVRFEDPEVDHVIRGCELTAHADAETKRSAAALAKSDLRDVILGQGRVAATLRARRADAARAMRASAWRRLSCPGRHPAAAVDR